MTVTEDQIFERAAVIVEERGLCKRRPEDGEGRVCTAQAIGLAIKGFEYDQEGVLCVFSRMHAMVGTIPSWNDRPERTAEEVVALLREAAVAVRRDSHTYDLSA